MRKSNEAVTAKFDDIKKRLEVESKDTEELVEQMTFMDSVKMTELPSRVKSIRTYVRTFDFIIGYKHVMTPEDLAEASKAFKQPTLLTPIFEQLEEKLRESREQFEDDVKKRVDEHTSATAEIRAEIDELQGVGDSSLSKHQLQEMVDKIADYQHQLEQANEKALALNTEEDRVRGHRRCPRAVGAGGQAVGEGVRIRREPQQLDDGPVHSPRSRTHPGQRR